MNALSPILSPDLTDALGWTLVHTLWQGLLIGLIVLGILAVRREAGPQFKYLVRVMGLAAILASAVMTFGIEYRQRAAAPAAAESATIVSKYESQVQITSDNIQNFNVLESSDIRQVLQHTFPWTTAVWLLGVILLSLRLAGGMIRAGRLRSRGISPLPGWLEVRFMNLIGRSGVRGSVRLKVSGKVVIPVVIGIIRPAILVPAAMISLMPAEQLDSILAHELAHIRRYDFLVNLIQSLMEVLFFYHPAVWILSEGIRRDREQCCDDLAINLCGKLSTYAKALAGLSELQSRPVLPSVALSRGKKHLLNRVERLVKPKKMKTNATEKIVAGMLILGSAIILTLGTGASLRPEASVQGASLQVELQSYTKGEAPHPGEMAEPGSGPVPTIPAVQGTGVESTDPGDSPGLTEPEAERNGKSEDTLTFNNKENMQVKDNVVTRTFVNARGEEKEMKFVIRGGQVRELYVNGEQIPAEGFPKYRKEIDRTLGDLNQMERELQHARQEIGNIDMADIQKEIQEEMQRFREQDMAKLQEEIKKIQEQHLDVQFDRQKMQEEIQKAMEEARIDQAKLREEMMKSQEEARKAMEEAVKDGRHTLDEADLEKIDKAVAEATEQLKNIDVDRMTEQLEHQLQEIQTIDFEKIQKQLETAMQEIDLEGIGKNLEESMQKMKLDGIDLEKQKKHLDEMIDELEKLELGKED